MITQVDVTNSRGAVLSLSMEEDEGGYQVADIEGLGPVKATLVSTSNAGVDGEVFQSAKRPARNIKIKLDLDPDFDPKGYEELRNDLYAWFMPKAKITMRYYMETGLYVDIDGIVEDMVPKIFDSDPDVTISIMCYQPDFIDARMVSVDSASVDDETNLEIDYPGTVESGTVVTINFNRALSEFSIYNTDEGGQRYQLDYSGDILNGDKIVISSLRGNKGLTLTRTGVSSSVLYNRSPQSSWIELTEGLNQFRVYAEGDPIPYTLEYVVRYGGL